MKTVVTTVALVIVLASAWPASAAEQLYRLPDVPAHPAQAAGYSLLAALTNTVYIPARFALTVATAGVGGTTGWLTGGDERAAESVWNLSAGQALISPAVLDGHESLHFGPWPRLPR